MRRPVGLLFRDLGSVEYSQGLALQREAQANLIRDRDQHPPMTVFLLEHDPPVITISRRPDAGRHLLAAPETLARQGIQLCETDRGGDITWHGPGQLVVYPILDLNRFGLRIGSYMRLLEQVVIDTLLSFGVIGARDPGATGVWVTPPDGGEPAKIAAMGVRVSRWVSMHGLALNVDPDLSHFEHIVPCGLAGRPVTSLRAQLGTPPDMALVKQRLSEAMSTHLQALARDIPAD